MKFSPPVLQHFAERALDGVGDRALGEWIEATDLAFHLRRRLTVDEAWQTGPVVDVRGTPDGQRRCERMRRLVPAEYLIAECGATRDH